MSSDVLEVLELQAADLEVVLLVFTSSLVWWYPRPDHLFNCLDLGPTIHSVLPMRRPIVSQVKAATMLRKHEAGRLSPPRLGTTQSRPPALTPHLLCYLPGVQSSWRGARLLRCGLLLLLLQFLQ